MSARSESTKESSSSSFLAATLAVLFFLVTLPLLRLPAIGSSSEAREVHVARIIHDTSEWLLPLRNGYVPSKPPLFHWAVAGLGFFTGEVNEATARCISLAAAALLFFLTLNAASSLSRLALQDKAASARRITLFAAFILATSYCFIRMSADARVDMFFALPAGAAILLAFRACASILAASESSEQVFSERLFIIFYLLCGLAVLAKGPLGLLLPGLIAFVMLWFSAGHRVALSTFLKPRIGWGVFLMIAIPWYVLAAQKGSDEFIGRQIVFENLSRFFGGENINREPFWFYVPAFFASMPPWSLLFAYYAVSEKRQANKAIRGPTSSSYLKVRQLCLIWVVVGIAFFSLSSGKRDAYLLPLLPAVAIYLSFVFEDKFLSAVDASRARWRRILVSSMPAVLLLFALVFAGALYTFMPLSFDSMLVESVFKYFQSLRIEVLIWILAVVLLSLVFYFGKRACEFSTGFLIFAFFSLALALGLGVKNDLKGFEYAAADVNDRINAAISLQAIRPRREELLDPMLYYLNREVRLIDPDGQIKECSGTYVAQEKYYVELQKIAVENNRKISLLARYRQIADDRNGRSDRDIVLFDCPIHQ